MLCWMKFVIFLIFFFPIISLFRLASKLPSYLKSITSYVFQVSKIICLDLLAWTKVMIMLLLLPLRIIFIFLLSLVPKDLNCLLTNQRLTMSHHSFRWARTFSCFLRILYREWWLSICTGINHSVVNYSVRITHPNRRKF